MPLTEQMAQLLKRPVELIPEHELNRHIREQVLREVVELWANPGNYRAHC
jgi:hypothetical protein